MIASIALHRYVIALQLPRKRFRNDSQSLCDRFAIALQPLQKRFTITLPSLSIAFKAFCNGFAIALQSIRKRFAIAL
jgi:hypothetical protein